MVLDPIPQSLPVHFFESRPQPPTSRCGGFRGCGIFRVKPISRYSMVQIQIEILIEFESVPRSLSFLDLVGFSRAWHFQWNLSDFYPPAHRSWCARKKRRMIVSKKNVYSCTKRPIFVYKEAYVCVKRDLCVCAREKDECSCKKRRAFESKVTYIHVQRDLYWCTQRIVL